MKKYMYFVIAGMLGLAMTGCKNHIPGEEPQPTRAIDFSYEVDQEQYTLDYYVGSNIRFFTTVEAKTEVKWDFGDGETAVGEVVNHKYIQAGTYKVTAEGNGGKKVNTIFIADIRPIVTQINDEATVIDGLVEVASSFISFDIELPNPDSLGAIFEWTFPAGTTNEAGDTVANFVQTIEPRSTKALPELGKVKFATVGSQSCKLQVKLQKETGSIEYRNLDLVVKNVQVGLNEEAPTLYYAVKDGNVMALKLPKSRSVEGVTIEPYDMGVSAGQHMMNILYDEGQLYLVDCGKQFLYCNDVLENMGDGKVSVMSVDASTMGTVITNVGGRAFSDPYVGYIDGDRLYLGDRRMGLYYIDKNSRNLVFNSLFDKEEGLNFFVNHWCGYYGHGLIYGAINGGFGKENGIWYICKRGNGPGLYRMQESDISSSHGSTWDVSEMPAAGTLFVGTPMTTYLHDTENQVYYFTMAGAATRGIFRIPEADIENFNPKISDEHPINPYALTFDPAAIDPATGSTAAWAGQILKPVVGNDNSSVEGMTDENVAICQLALDKNTGDVYMLYRSSEEQTTPSGLVRYNAETGYLEYVIQGIKGYGCTICPIESKLFN